MYASNRGWFQADDFRLYYKGTSGVENVPVADGLRLRAGKGALYVDSDRETSLSANGKKGDSNGSKGSISGRSDYGSCEKKISGRERAESFGRMVSGKRDSAGGNNQSRSKSREIKQECTRFPHCCLVTILKAE